MDPAGFEPASATVTECRVPLTLRALIAVSRGAGIIARMRVTIFLVGFKSGRHGARSVPGDPTEANGRIPRLTESWNPTLQNTKGGAPGIPRFRKPRNVGHPATRPAEPNSRVWPRSGPPAKVNFPRMQAIVESHVSKTAKRGAPGAKRGAPGTRPISSQLPVSGFLVGSTMSPHA